MGHMTVICRNAGCKLLVTASYYAAQELCMHVHTLVIVNQLIIVCEQVASRWMRQTISSHEDEPQD